MRCRVVKRVGDLWSGVWHAKAARQRNVDTVVAIGPRPPVGIAALATAIAVLFAGSPTAFTQDEVDLSAELPRIEPLSPDDALKAFELPPGFRIELVAAEPLVFDPVAISYDEHGRAYVVEMRGYSEQDNENRGQIACLEDVNGDGRYDKRHVLVDGLSWPTAVICWDGGVFVGAAPDIWYFKDTDGDHAADVRKRVFTGFGKSNVQGLLNSFRWGPDNRIHGATSSSGGSIQRVDDNDQPIGEPLNLNRRDFAFDPSTLVMTAESGGAQHGMSFDDFGTKYVCSNSDHLQQVMFEDRYVARNPYAAAPSPRQMIAADGPQADVFRASPVEPWRIVRTRLRVSGEVKGIVEGGGRAAGYFTGATGVTVFRGHGSPHPDSMTGSVIIGDVGSNLVHQKYLTTRDGLIMTGKRAIDNSELVRSRDIWFRPVQFANGPDGCLHILDMYREVIEHPKSLPPMIKKHLDLTSGRDRGRIWRLVPPALEQPVTAELPDVHSTQGLVNGLISNVGWTRDTCSRLLATRKDPAAIPPLRNIIHNWRRDTETVHALHLLDAFDTLDAGTLLKALKSPSPEINVIAIRLSESPAIRRGVGSTKGLLSHPAIREALFSLVDAPELKVRYQLAFTLGELDGLRRVDALAKLIRTDGDNKWMQVAIESSSNGVAGELLSRVTGDETLTGETRTRWINSLASQVRQRNDPAETTAVFGLVRRLSADEARKPLAKTIAAALSKDAKPDFQRRVAEALNGDNPNWLRDQLAAAIKVISQDDASTTQKVTAIGQLAIGSYADVSDLFDDLLQPSRSAEIQQAIIQTTARFDDADATTWLIERRSELGPTQQLLVDDVLWSRTSSAKAFLTAVSDGNVPRATVSSEAIRRFVTHPDATIAKAASSLIDTPTSAEMQALIAKYTTAIESTKGNAAAGKLVFEKHCASCHKVGDLGKPIGPNLLAAVARGQGFLLTNILDPNREVDPAFQTYTIILNDGRVLSGVITAETATSLTLGDNKGESTTILRTDIETLQRTGRSLMPEGLEKQVSAEDLAGVFEWLQSGGTTSEKQ